VKTKSEFCVCTRVHTPHTHIWRIAKLSDQTLKQNPSIGQQLSQQSQHHTPSIELHYSNSCQQFSAYIYSIHALTSNRFWVGPQAPQPFIYPFVYQPTCTTLGLICACNQMNRVSGVDSRSLPGSWVTHSRVCYPVSQCPIPETNTRHHALSRIHETKLKWLDLRATLFHNYTRKQRGVSLHWRLLVFASDPHAPYPECKIAEQAIVWSCDDRKGYSPEDQHFLKHISKRNSNLPWLPHPFKL